MAMERPGMSGVIVDSVLKQGRKALAENEVKMLLRESGIPTTDFQVVTSYDEVDQGKLKFPVVMKVCSPDILHKTDVGGVVLDVQKDQFEEEFARLRKKFVTEPILVESMQDRRVEVIIGLIDDPTFGLTIMFGLGGIYTEVYKDVTFRVVPIKRRDAEEMLTEIKAAPILEGYRKIKVDRDALLDLLLQVSDLGVKYMESLDQMDLNPVFVKEKGVVVVDAKMLFR
ncbi:MAG: acetate--CoA ligase family protein [Methanobacteriota archaeon]|nr:MAG: acetate--CoA ligase family protein [Euryarchaeota archaeon]